LEKLIDGKLVVETTQLELPAEEVIRRYKELQIIEHGFRCLKSSLKLRPFYHWTEKRIRAHVFICILALQMERTMKSRLSESNTSVETAIEKLRQVKAGELTVNWVKTPILSAIGKEQKAIYRQLELSFPKINDLKDM